MGQQQGGGRAESIGTALVFGLPLTAGVLLFLHQPMFEDTLVQRYVHHPIEQIEIGVFCCALAALVAKALGCLRQRRAVRAGMLPAWDGVSVPPAAAQPLLAQLSSHSPKLQQTWLGRRCHAVLDYLCRRNSAAGLDDHVRTLADNDAMALESSYSFLRFLVWSVPILGFLGTVIGITDAIAGVSPDQLEHDMSGVTSGLATAFDTTGLALMLTMLTMLVTFVVERFEQRALQSVDAYVDVQLFHRFSRPENAHAPVLYAVQELVERQADIWAASLGQVEKRQALHEQKQQDRFTQTLQTVLDEQMTRWSKAAEARTAETLKPLARLAAAIQQQTLALRPQAESMSRLAGLLSELQQSEGQLARLQNLLQHNLAALSAAGSFEEAVHSLNAAVHLLSARAGMTGKLRAVGGDDARSAA